MEKNPAILKINKINKMNQSQHDCSHLPQTELSDGRLCNPRSFGDHQFILVPLWMTPGSWGALRVPSWGDTLLPGASGAPHAQRWLEPMLLSCLGGFVGDGMAVGRFGVCPWLAEWGCRAPSNSVCWELRISKGKHRQKRQEREVGGGACR